MKRLFVLAMVAVVGVATWRWHGAAREVASGDAQLVQDRLWIDHMPRSERDTFQLFLALTEQPIGVYQQASAWKGSYELFRYELHGGELRVMFPQDGTRETVQVNARKCHEEGMDFCLELDGGSRGAKRYYSRKGWEIKSLAAEQAKVAELAGPAK
jgi:hypothetical protein